MLRVVLARAARSARRTTHFDLDFPRDAAARAVLVPQAPSQVPPGRRARAIPAPLHARHARADRSSSRACAGRGRRGCPHGDARESTLDGPFDGVVTSPPVSGPDRLPRAAPLRLRAARARRPTRAGDRRRRRRDVRAAFARTRRDRRRPRERARRAASGAPVVIVVNDRRDLYPEILERAGLRLEQRATPARQPPHRAPRGRVLRGRAGRPLLAVRLASARGGTQISGSDL